MMTNTLWTLARQHRSWAAGLLAALVTSAAVAAPVYQVVDLGGAISGKGGTSEPHAINAQGDVVGYAGRRNDLGVSVPRPVLFRDRKPLDLISKSGVGDSEGRAVAIDQSGRIAVQLGGGSAHIYSKGTMDQVVVPNFSGTTIWGLSDQGHILVHGYDVGDGIEGLTVRQPGGTWLKLQRWNHSDSTVGHAINKQGAVVGYGEGSKHNGYRQALLWLYGTPQPVTGTEGLVSEATAINERGDIAGHRYRSGYNRAFVVRDAQLTELSTASVDTFALGMDNIGRVVGYQLDALGFVDAAFLAQDGQMLRLDDLVEPAQQGQWQIKKAVAINDAGAIAAVGQSIATGKWRTLKLVPVPAH